MRNITVFHRNAKSNKLTVTREDDIRIKLDETLSVEDARKLFNQLFKIARQMIDESVECTFRGKVDKRRTGIQMLNGNKSIKRSYRF